MKATTEKEKLALVLTKINEISPRREIRKKIHIGRLEIIFSWRSKKNFMGRFGGGWNWSVGVQWSKTTTIFSLFIFEIILNWKKRDETTH